MCEAFLYSGLFNSFLSRYKVNSWSHLDWSPGKCQLISYHYLPNVTLALVLTEAEVSLLSADRSLFQRFGINKWGTNNIHSSLREVFFNFLNQFSQNYYLQWPGRTTPRFKLALYCCTDALMPAGVKGREGLFGSVSEGNGAFEMVQS